MTIQAVTADGVTHEFPDGTPDSVIDGAIQTYVKGQAKPDAPKPTLMDNVANAGKALAAAPMTWAENFGHDFAGRQKDASQQLVDTVMHPNPALRAVPFAHEGKVALDAVNTVVGPLYGAAVDQVAGRPVEALSGGKIPHQAASDVIGGVVPILGEANDARLLAKAADAAGMTSPGLAAINKQAAATRAALPKPSAPKQPGPVAPIVAKFSDKAAAKQAGQKIASRATDLAAVKESLADGPDEIVPGSVPTTFQQTGDMGLGSLEREQATAPGGPEQFNQRRADQNVAQRKALAGVQSGGDPNDVAKALKAHFDEVDAISQSGVEAATKTAQEGAQAIGGHDTPEAYGAQVRGKLNDAQEAASAHEGKLWDAVDPNGDLTANTTTTSAGAQKVKGDMATTAKPMEGDEAAIFDTAASLPALAPAQDLIALKSRVSTALRKQLLPDGDPQAYRRLSQLQGHIHDNLANTIAHKVALDDAAVARGELHPEDALISRLKAALDADPGEQVAARTGHGAIPGGAPRDAAPGAAGPSGAARQAGRGPGNAPGGPGLPTSAELAAAKDDLTAWRAPSARSLFAAVKKLGGIKVRDPISGSQLAGPDVAAALTDVRYPGLVNNQAGLPPERMAQAFADAGWFGPNHADPSGAFEEALTREARGSKVFHPDDLTSTQKDVRAQLERDISAAGVSTKDTPAVAAEKLARHRVQQREIGAVAEASGIPGAEHMQPHELLGDLQERAAIQAEGRAPHDVEDPAGAEFDRLAGVNQNPSFDEAAVARLKLATAATKQKHATFGIDPLKPILQSRGTADQFAMPDGQVPGRVFHPGPTGFTHVQAALKAAPDALPVLQDHAAMLLRRAAVDTNTGIMDSAKFERWAANHQDALRALGPETQARFADAAKAGEAVAEAGAARAQALKNAQVGAIGRVMNLTEPEDVAKTIGSIMNGRTAVADMKQLAAAARRAGPEAVAGLRQAIADHIALKFIGNTEVGASGVTAIKADGFQNLVRQNRSALAQVFSPEEVRSIEAIAADIQRAKRSETAIRLPAGPGTAQDILAAGKGKQVGVVRSALNWIAGIAGFTHGGFFAAIPAMLGTHIIQGLRTAGIERVDQLVTAAMLDPNLARVLLQKVPNGTGPAAKAALHIRARAILRAAGAAGAVSVAAQHAPAQSRPAYQVAQPNDLLAYAGR